VTEKNERDILGQVIVPLTDLTSLRCSQPVRRPLQPHKKCPVVAGDLVFEAWISAGQLPSQTQQHVAMTTMTSHEDEADKVSSALPAGLRKLKDRFTAQHSPILSRSVLGFILLIVLCLSELSKVRLGK